MTTNEQEIESVQSKIRWAEEQVLITDAQIDALRPQRVAAFEMARDNREWLLKNAPRPDYTTDRAALKDLMRSIHSYGLHNLGVPVLSDWVRSFGHEFFLGTACHTSGPRAYLPFVGITVPPVAELDDLAKRTEALAEVIKPDAGPVTFRMGGYPRSQFHYLSGPDDQVCEEWTVSHGPAEHGVHIDQHGDLPDMLAFIQHILPNRENADH